jgi:Ca2+-transporting ATPase
VIQARHIAVKGRARYRIKGLYRSDILKKHLESKLSERDGINSYSINTLTGTILIFFNSEQTHTDIALILQGIVAEHCKKNGKAQSVRSNHSPPSSRVTESRRTLRKSILRAEPQELHRWHMTEAGSVLEFFGTNRESGFTAQDVVENLKKFGPNILPESVPRSGWSIFLEQFKSLPVALLGVAAAISIATGGLADALVIVGVVCINACIGYASESGTEKTIYSLKSLVRPSALVYRESRIREVNSGEVVPGDLLVLRPGTYVSADARLIEATHLSVDESALTGESMPVTKTTSLIMKDDISLADRLNMVYMGTLVTGGQGIAVVVATGRFTEMGHIQTILGQARPPETPMEKKLDQMSQKLVLISGAVCGVVFVIGLLRGYGILQMIKTSISLAVAAVPEGLPTVATTTLAIGIRNMRRHNVLIRRLEAVETLGSVQTICLDKTGTLTMNRMSVREIYSGMKRMKVQDGKYLSDTVSISPYSCPELLMLLNISVLCNESEMIRKNGEYIVTGSPTENAFIHMTIETGLDVHQIRRTFPLLHVLHRSEKRNIMLTLHGQTNNEGRLVAVKGSPREVLDLCAWHMKDGAKLPLTDEDRTIIELENEYMGGEAFRILGLAYASSENDLHEKGEEVLFRKEFIWLGIAGIADPVRQGVKTLMGEFHRAGIDTVMITGDQSPTAYAIARELNLSNGQQLEILDSRHLTNIPPEILTALCERAHVFARVTPSHKLQIVQALQGAGKIVAMTGDGINDGPALKAADIGIAMGHTGTDVAREVADVIIEDDNLQTMIIAVSYGRTIYNNIRKSLHFLLSTNMSEIMVMFSAITLGLGQPLNAMQLLWINLLSDIFPGLALALEPPEPDVLNHPPRPAQEEIIKPSDFKRITFESAVLSAGALSAYGYGIARYGIGPQAGTLAFTSLTIGQLLHSLSCRSDHISIFDQEKLPANRYLKIALGGSLFLQVLAMAVPGLRSLLGITTIGLMDGAVIGASALLPLFVNEITKTQRKDSGKIAHTHVFQPVYQEQS